MLQAAGNKLLTQTGIEVQAAEQAARLAALTQSDPNDPLRQQYGDSPLIQSRSVTGRKWTAIDKLTPALEGQKVGQPPEGCSMTVPVDASLQTASSRSWAACLILGVMHVLCKRLSQAMLIVG